MKIHHEEARRIERIFSIDFPRVASGAKATHLCPALRSGVFSERSEWKNTFMSRPLAWLEKKGIGVNLSNHTIQI